MGLLSRLLGGGLFPEPPAHPRIKANHGRFKGFDQNAALDGLEFCVLDTELSGMTPGRHEIVSIGAVKVKNLCINPGETFYSLVRPKGDLATPSTLVHRITTEELRQARDMEEVLPEFLDFCQDSLLVGHYIDLDMAFVNLAVHRAFGGLLLNPCLDTLRLAQIYEEKRFGLAADGRAEHVSYNLGDLVERYGLPRFAAHNSLADAMQTAYLFVYLVKKIGSGNVRTLKDLWSAGRKWWLA
jgi:DNA polymerase III subunit epsilon